MLCLRRPLQSTRRVVLLLWLLATLAPALAQGLTVWRNQGQPWNELCVSASLNGAAAAMPGHPGDVAHEHCDACLARLDPMAPAPAAWGAPVAGQAPGFVPPLYLHARAPQFAWHGGQPRAPPLPA
jgi:hypothetical protein